MLRLLERAHCGAGEERKNEGEEGAAAPEALPSADRGAEEWQHWRRGRKSSRSTSSSKRVRRYDVKSSSSSIGESSNAFDSCTSEDSHCVSQRNSSRLRCRRRIIRRSSKSSNDATLLVSPTAAQSFLFYSPRSSCTGVSAIETPACASSVPAQTQQRLSWRRASPSSSSGCSSRGRTLVNAPQPQQPQQQCQCRVNTRRLCQSSGLRRRRRREKKRTGSSSSTWEEGIAGSSILFAKEEAQHTCHEKHSNSNEKLVSAPAAASCEGSRRSSSSSALSLFSSPVYSATQTNIFVNASPRMNQGFLSRTVQQQREENSSSSASQTAAARAPNPPQRWERDTEEGLRTTALHHLQQQAKQQHNHYEGQMIVKGAGKGAGAAEAVQQQQIPSLWSSVDVHDCVTTQGQTLSLNRTNLTTGRDEIPQTPPNTADTSAKGNAAFSAPPKSVFRYQAFIQAPAACSAASGGTGATVAAASHVTDPEVADPLSASTARSTAAVPVAPCLALAGAAERRLLQRAERASADAAAAAQTQHEKLGKCVLHPMMHAAQDIIANGIATAFCTGRRSPFATGSAAVVCEAAALAPEEMDTGSRDVASFAAMAACSGVRQRHRRRTADATSTPSVDATAAAAAAPAPAPADHALNPATHAPAAESTSSEAPMPPAAEPAVAAVPAPAAMVVDNSPISTIEPSAGIAAECAVASEAATTTTTSASGGASFAAADGTSFFSILSYSTPIRPLPFSSSSSPVVAALRAYSSQAATAATWRAMTPHRQHTIDDPAVRYRAVETLSRNTQNCVSYGGRNIHASSMLSLPPPLPSATATAVFPLGATATDVTSPIISAFPVTSSLSSSLIAAATQPSGPYKPAVLRPIPAHVCPTAAAATATFSALSTSPFEENAEVEVPIDAFNSPEVAGPVFRGGRAAAPITTAGPAPTATAAGPAPTATAAGPNIAAAAPAAAAPAAAAARLVATRFSAPVAIAPAPTAAEGAASAPTATAPGPNMPAATGPTATAMTLAAISALTKAGGTGASGGTEEAAGKMGGTIYVAASAAEGKEASTASTAETSTARAATRNTQKTFFPAAASSHVLSGVRAAAGVEDWKFMLPWSLHTNQQQLHHEEKKKQQQQHVLILHQQQQGQQGHLQNQQWEEKAEVGEAGIVAAEAAAADIAAAEAAAREQTTRTADIAGTCHMAPRGALTAGANPVVGVKQRNTTEITEALTTAAETEAPDSRSPAEEAADTAAADAKAADAETADAETADAEAADAEAADAEAAGVGAAGARGGSAGGRGYRAGETVILNEEELGAESRATGSIQCVGEVLKDGTESSRSSEEDLYSSPPQDALYIHSPSNVADAPPVVVAPSALSAVDAVNNDLPRGTAPSSTAILPPAADGTPTISAAVNQTAINYISNADSASAFRSSLTFGAVAVATETATTSLESSPVAWVPIIFRVFDARRDALCPACRRQQLLLQRQSHQRQYQCLQSCTLGASSNSFYHNNGYAVRSAHPTNSSSRSGSRYATSNNSSRNRRVRVCAWTRRRSKTNDAYVENRSRRIANEKLLLDPRFFDCEDMQEEMEKEEQQQRGQFQRQQPYFPGTINMNVREHVGGGGASAAREGNTDAARGRNKEIAATGREVDGRDAAAAEGSRDAARGRRTERGAIEREEDVTKRSKLRTAQGCGIGEEAAERDNSAAIGAGDVTLHQHVLRHPSRRPAAGKSAAADSSCWPEQARGGNAAEIKGEGRSIMQEGSGERGEGGTCSGALPPAGEDEEEQKERRDCCCECLYVIGNHRLLGWWGATGRGVALTTSPSLYPYYISAPVLLPRHMRVVQYKFAQQDSSSPGALSFSSLSSASSSPLSSPTPAAVSAAGGPLCEKGNGVTDGAGSNGNEQREQRQQGRHQQKRQQQQHEAGQQHQEEVSSRREGNGKEALWKVEHIEGERRLKLPHAAVIISHTFGENISLTVQCFVGENDYD